MTQNQQPARNNAPPPAARQAQPLRAEEVQQDHHPHQPSSETDPTEQSFETKTSPSDPKVCYARLQACLNDLNDKVDTSLRTVLTRFYPCLDPSRAKSGANEFPIQYRPHGRTPLRSLYTTARELVCHEVCLAFLRYYDTIRVEEDEEENVTGDVDRQISRLEEIVREFPNVVVDGSHLSGYRLLTINEFEKLEAAREKAEAKKYS